MQPPGQNSSGQQPQADTESILQFPCEIAVKAFGSADGNDFDTLVFSLVRRHVPNLGEGALRSRMSAGGRYVAVTVTIQAESRAQMDAIYRDLSAEERVVMAL